MATIRVSNIIFETFHNPYINKWMVKIYDRNHCYFKARRLREGTYPIFNNVMVKVDYLNAPQHAPLSDYPVSIEFLPGCQIERGFSEPCG